MRKCTFIIIILLIVVSCQTKDHKNYIQNFDSHFSKIISNCTDKYGPKNTPLWLSMWNLETNQYPFDFSHSDSIPCRVYLDRSVDAPGGSTLYWDLPDIAAAVEISKQTGNQNIEEAAKNYVKYYLENSTAKNGIILWGNHYYYDVLLDTTVKLEAAKNHNPLILKQKPEITTKCGPSFLHGICFTVGFPEELKNTFALLLKCILPIP